MSTQEIPFGGWSRNLRLANESVELIISLEVGPRILSYRTLQGTNVFHNYPAQMGQTGEKKWMNRGGHRLWISPEDTVLSYLPDNQPFPYEVLDALTVRLTSPGDAIRNIRKDLTLRLAATGSAVELIHTLTNETGETHTVAPWALSVMAPNGISFLPQPPLGAHPRDLLPDRALILWPYSDATDARFHMGQRFVSLRHVPDRSPFKFGLAHREKWAAYLVGDQLFVKSVAFFAEATYPDFGCNYESYTDSDMLEIETLGALVHLAPGQSISHLENWQLFSGINPPPYSDSADFADWLQPYLP